MRRRLLAWRPACRRHPRPGRRRAGQGGHSGRRLLPAAAPTDAIPVQADGGPAREATQAGASFASAANRFRTQDPRRGWAAFGMESEVRAGAILRFCPEPRREIALAETTLHLALARRGQGMPIDRARRVAAAAIV